MVWSEIAIQRCLFHIQSQSVSWLREKPKTKEARTLKRIVGTLSEIDSQKEALRFIRLYELWRAKYGQKVIERAKESIAKKDIKKTMTLIDNALKDIFHHIEIDPNIQSTTNMVESFFGHLKESYRTHKGLSTEHRIQWLKWWCWFKSSATK
ncbi:hypothetical protein AGMMS50229_14740 [Campylobacterota bacterium]|nr:hypothetical protein AGMMS50229_14740 [Campylobacterota bacterium]